MSIVWSFMVNGSERLVSGQEVEEQVRQGSPGELSYLSPMADSERAIELNRVGKNFPTHDPENQKKAWRRLQQTM